MLSNFTVPEGVTDIAPFAFAYCKNLSVISLPSSLCRIADSSFFNVPNDKLKIKCINNEIVQQWAKEHGYKPPISQMSSFINLINNDSPSLSSSNTQDAIDR